MADRALLFGINTYRSIPGLRGCLNDVAAMHALLVDVIGFDPAGVKTLTDGDATGPIVRAHLRWLAADAAPGDRLLLHGSSHGSYTADLSGDEPDGLDEIICLHGMDWADPASYLLDDEMGAWVAAVPAGVDLTVVLDCCHSGTGTREVATRPGHDPTRPRRGPRVQVSASAAAALETPDPADPALVLARFAAPPPALEALAHLPRRPGRAARAAAAKADAVLFAACRADQTAADAFLGGDFRGAFTYHFTSILRAAGPGLARAELMGRLARALRAGGFEQVPQLEAARPRGVVLGPKPRAGRGVSGRGRSRR